MERLLDIVYVITSLHAMSNKLILFSSPIMSVLFTFLQLSLYFFLTDKQLWRTFLILGMLNGITEAWNSCSLNPTLAKVVSVALSFFYLHTLYLISKDKSYLKN